MYLLAKSVADAQMNSLGSLDDKKHLALHHPMAEMLQGYCFASSYVAMYDEEDEAGKYDNAMKCLQRIDCSLQLIDFWSYRTLF